MTALAGGSTATVRRVVGPGRRALVVKTVERCDGAVDGHDLASFRAKIRHQRWLRAFGGEAGRRYPVIRRETHGAGWSTVAMDWHPGRPLVDVLAERGEAGTPLVAALLDDLHATGYRRLSAPAPAARGTEMYGERIGRRLDYLRDTPLRALLDRRSLAVGPVTAAAPRRLLATIAREPRLRRAAAPPRLAFPLHGDLNLRNVLVRRDGAAPLAYSLLDPRGDVRPWDPLYDLGKMLFSALLYEEVAARAPAVAAGGPTLDVLLAPQWHALGGAARSVAAGAAACDAVTGEAGWETRLGFVVAAHALAEAGCRISVGRARGPGGAAAAPEVARATALLALGTLLLDQWVAGVAARRPPAVADQLALLAVYAAPAAPATPAAPAAP